MPLISSSTKGVFVIAVTPFTPDGDIDWPSLDRVIDFYMEAGADGLTILGMMGEAPKLTPTEALEITRATLKRMAGRPVIVGVSAPGLAAIRDLTAAVMDEGASGVLVAPPGSLTTNETIRAYYGNVIDTIGTDVPVCLQDFPLATGVNISVPTMNQIFNDHPSIVMLKHEDWPGLEKITAIRKAEAAGQVRRSIFVANAGLFLAEEMRRGADGSMTGFAYPEMLAQVVKLSEAGDYDRAQDLFDAYLPLVRYEAQPGLGLAVRKYVLAKRGAIASPAMRKPGASLSPEAMAEVDFLMGRLEKRLAELG
ncbi:dihydrodipicolinate synthase family protein [Pseudooceanicola sp. HF7]|uniref:dihydrodipicolinate synthase family protein n=1 Tax=Pseudooceanicola sp. HF7 TaxID=2721560 RepID=UPI001430A043|nr:dihydrodipicolinate synthase family protein [Pseudooceanicola sp. HF7]NIZ08592.1 dihydrodipicolinate synthase family protein [Pseudooceanicola sp. HF7]